MDVFRIFDSVNYLENMRLGIDCVGEAGGIIEAACCYTGDVTDPHKGMYDLEYYLNFVRQLHSLGIHVLAIKDMAGLLKPEAATMLISAIRQEFPEYVFCLLGNRVLIQNSLLTTSSFLRFQSSHSRTHPRYCRNRRCLYACMCQSWSRRRRCSF